MWKFCEAENTRFLTLAHWRKFRMTTWKKIPSYGKLFSFIRNEILRCWIFARLPPFNTTACYKRIGETSCLYFQGKFSAVTYLKSYPDDGGRVFIQNIGRGRLFRRYPFLISTGILAVLRSFVVFVSPCRHLPGYDSGQATSPSTKWFIIQFQLTTL